MSKGEDSFSFMLTIFRGFSVLDIGGGKGGDLLKYVKSRASNVVIAGTDFTSCFTLLYRYR